MLHRRRCSRLLHLTCVVHLDCLFLLHERKRVSIGRTIDCAYSGRCRLDSQLVDAARALLLQAHDAELVCSRRVLLEATIVLIYSHCTDYFVALLLPAGGRFLPVAVAGSAGTLHSRRDILAARLAPYLLLLL